MSHETVAIPSTYSFINIKPGDDYKNREIHREGSAQFFNDVSPGLAEAELLFWLIHFWFVFSYLCFEYATKATDNMCNKGSGIAAKPRGIENVITITAYGSSISLLQWLNRTKVETIALFCSVFFLNLSSCSFNITFSRKFLIFYYSQPNNVDSEISMLKGYYVSRSLYWSFLFMINCWFHIYIFCNLRLNVN